MEIDMMLSQLNRELDHVSGNTQLAKDEIKDAMHRKAMHIADKVNRTIVWEGGSMVLMLLLGSCVLVFVTHALLQAMALFSIIVCLGMGVFYWYKYQKIKGLVRFEGNTVKLLQGLIGAIGQLIKLYIWLVGLSMAVGFILGGAYGIMEALAENNNTNQTNMPDFLKGVLAIPISLGAVLASVLLTRWYIFKLYGKPLAALKSCLAELQEEK